MALSSCRDPCGLTYTACYCEENIWKLCHRIKCLEADQIKHCYVLFISNQKEMVPIWGQKAGDEKQDHLVVWDYHVIMLHEALGAPVHVYDFDTVLPFPSCFEQYCAHNLRESAVKSTFHYMFRLIPAAQFLETFASDRSRMRNKDGVYLKPPPEYECIRTPNETNNLNQFICMEQSFPVGQVLTLSQLKQRFSRI